MTSSNRSGATLKAMDKALVANYQFERRSYLGASQIGDPCERKLWYSFRWVLKRELSASQIKDIQSGFHGEEIMRERLAAIEGISLTAEQKNFSDFGGHFQGHIENIITGLHENPEEEYIWENKIKEIPFIRKLNRLIEEHGEHNALKYWDKIYYAQAQINMMYHNIKWQFMTIIAPGARSCKMAATDKAKDKLQLSCITPYDEEEANLLTKKAERIIFAEEAPYKLSHKPEYYLCKMCEFSEICHKKKLPEVNCRTCLHSTAQKDGTWHCAKSDKILSVEEQKKGCDKHLFFPTFIGEPVAATEDSVIYDNGIINYQGGKVK
jgi:hypothetical protein